MANTKSKVNRNVPDSDSIQLRSDFWNQKWINPISGFEERIYSRKNEPTKHFNYEH
jgi:hypothetical protein